MLWRRVKQETGTLHITRVCHLNTPAVHKHYNSIKYSCTTEMHGFANTYNYINAQCTDISSTMYHNERPTYGLGLWMVNTAGQQMFL
jgi:hypothetical protein